jgi:hypothetical protein
MQTPVQHLFDIFEILPTGEPVWRAAVNGHDKAIRKLCELTSAGPNVFRLVHLPTKAVIATLNQPKKLKIM